MPGLRLVQIITTRGWCSCAESAVLGVYVRLKREEGGAGSS
jgi:hypothetical protein